MLKCICTRNDDMAIFKASMEFPDIKHVCTLASCFSVTISKMRPWKFKFLGFLITIILFTFLHFLHFNNVLRDPVVLGTQSKNICKLSKTSFSYFFWRFQVVSMVSIYLGKWLKIGLYFGFWGQCTDLLITIGIDAKTRVIWAVNDLMALTATAVRTTANCVGSVTLKIDGIWEGEMPIRTLPCVVTVSSLS